MKRLLSYSLFFGILLLTNQAFAQQINEKCGTMVTDSIMRSKIPGAPSLEVFENWLQDQMNNPAIQQQRRQVITIPVIIHVIHNGDAVGSNENISAAQVYSQIDVLNEDFRRLNSDTVNTPSGFRPVAADVEIEFCPALRDPQGNVLAEPGINRVNAGQASWPNTNDIDNTLKPSTIWDPDNYFNMWSVNFGSGSSLLGYAQFPEGSGLAGMPGGAQGANTDGVVVRYTAFGRVGTLGGNTDRGRTMTHEVGHWLGLRHIWGDGGCGADDYCNDTPESDAANYGCQNTSSCGSTDMVQNYMDYSDDDCMNLFTQCQKTRMQTVMAVSPRRLSLLSSNVCTPLTPVYISGQVRDGNTLQGVPFAKVRLLGVGNNGDILIDCDANGNFIDTLYEGDFNIYGGAWGYQIGELPNQTLANPVAPIIIDVFPGYYDDFTLDYDWTVTGNASTGEWERDAPIGTDYNGADCNPGADVQTDYAFEAYVTGNGGGAAGTDDIDGGNTVLTSPVFDLSGYNEPYISYYRWFYNDGGNNTPDDELEIRLSNGNTTVVVENFTGSTANGNQWRFNNIRVRDYLTPTNNMRFIIEASDGVTSSDGHLVEAGLDVFSVVDSVINTNIPPIALFGANTPNICFGQTVNFTDNSSNAPTSWAWSFPGGTPATSTQQNPSVTYNTPGTYNVTLIATNAFGSDTLTRNAFINVSDVVPDFVANKTSGCAGLTVQFTDVSSCNPTTWNWSFPGGSPSTSTQQNPVVTYNSPGTYNVTLIANGNTLTRAGYITVNNTGAVNLLFENFESGSFTTNGWSVDNPDGGITWQIANVAGNGAGTNAAGIALFNYNSIGQRDRLITPVLNLSNVTGTELTFKHAYRRDNASRRDSLIVYVSTNGGATYPNRVLVAAEDGTGTFATNTTMGAAFTPVAADDWCFSGTVGASCFTVDLSAFDGQSNVRIRFESYNDSENNIYLDDIVISGTCSTPAPAPIADFSGDVTDGCGSLTVNFTDQSQNGPTSWNWGFPGGTPNSSTQQNPTVTYANPGSYDVTLVVTNAQGSNTLTLPGYITVNALPSASITTIDVTCNGNSNGSATAAVTGGSTPYGYLWSNSGTSASISSLQAGNYTVTITDANGCTTSATDVVSAPSAITVTTSNTAALCGGANGTATASPSGGTGPYTYAWSSGATTATATGLANGNYTVTVRDANNCSATASVTVASSTVSPNVNFNIQNVSCFGLSDGSITATASGGTAPYTFTWNNGGATGTITGLASGNYDVTVVDANGCSFSTGVFVSQPTAITIAETVTDATCGNTNGAIDISVSGGTSPYSYSWSAGGTGTSLTNLASGSYTVTVTDNVGCTATSTVSVSNVGGPTATASTQPVSCFGGSDGQASVVASGGTAPYTYAWSSGGTGSSVNGLAAGSYTVTITDNGGCSAVRTVTISQPTAITVVVTPQSSTCGAANGQGTASATGGNSPYSYAWSNGSFGISTTGLAAGSYTVTVTDGNGCTVAQGFTINNTAGPSLSTTVIDVSCQGGADGSATAVTSGGTAPFTFVWSNGDNNATAANLAAGSYTVTVTDANGCTATASANVADGNAINLSLSVTDATCGAADGAINSTVSGGVGPYTYLWSTGQISEDLSSITGGSYSITVTDANGCYASDTVVVGNQGAPVVTLTATDVSCAGAGDGSVTLSASGGATPYTYNWSNGSNMQNLNNVQAGTYTVTLTDQNGCVSIQSATVGAPAAIVVQLTVVDATCTQAVGSASAAVTGGNPPYTYAWSNGGNTNSVNNLSAGNYDVTVTDGSGCSTVESFSITQVAAASVNLVSQHVSCAGGNDGSIGVVVNSGTGPFSYLWSNGQTGLGLSNLSSGIYSVTITDGNGCTVSYADTLNEPAALSLSFIITDLACGNGQGGAKVVPQGGVAPYTYSWTDGSTSNPIQVTQSGVFGVTVTDANGCTISDAITVGQGNSLLTDMTVAPDTSNAGLGSATVTPLNGVAPYIYNWSNGDTAATATGLTAGTYLVTVSDDGGCTTVDTAVIGNVTGIAELTQLQKVELYPNPTTGEFMIRFNGIKQLVNVKVFDALGKEVITREVDVLANPEISVDISNFPEGMYFVRLQLGTTSVHRKLIFTAP